MSRPATRVFRFAHVIVPALLFAGTPARAALADAASDTTVVRPMARAETEPVPHIGDAADTPSIWIHPTDPGRSLIIATEKKSALMVYGMDGGQRQTLSKGSRPNDVGVLYGFPLDGATVDLAVAGCRSPKGPGVKVWVIDAVADTLRDVTDAGVIPVFGGTVPYGVGVYKSRRTSRCYFVVTSKTGQLEEYQLRDTTDGKVGATRVRAWSMGSITEGCVADNELGNLFLSEEHLGIWRFDAEPDGSNTGELIAKVGEHGLTADVEGLALYCANGGVGYLLASSQGNSVFNLYTREGDHHYVLTVDPRAGEIGDVEHTDGIAVTSCPTSSTFPLGLFVAHDGDNGALNQNFKLFGWEDIAGSRLIVDPHWSPRTPEVPRGLAQGSPASMAPGSSPVAVGVAGDSTCVHGGSNEPLLETESACLASPGSLTLGVGLERGAVLHGRTESTIPFALSFAAARRLELVVEPILYSHVQQRGQTLAAGVGDLEVNAIFAPLPEFPWRGSVAVSAEVKLPVARRSPLGSGKPDITGALVLSRPVAGADVHVNLGYTIIGHPSGIDTRNVYSFAVAAIRRLSQFDLVGEVFGHTPALADGREPEEIDGGANALPDLAGEELVCTLGGRLRLGDRAAIGVRVSYDEDRMFLVSPMLSLKLH